MLYNRFSFLMFGSTLPDPADLLLLPGANASPKAASVIVVPGEPYAVYIPSTANLNGAINLYSDGNVLKTGGIGTINAIAVAPDVNHYLASFMIPLDTALPDGYYRLGIGTARSNRVWLRKSGYANSSALFSFRNRRAIGPIAYDLPELNTFRNVLRLKCTLGPQTTDTSLETYEVLTTGEKRVVESKTHHAINISCPNTDALGHEGWRTLLAHKDILINGATYNLKQGYTETEPVGTLSTGSFDVWEQAYTVVNRC